MKILKLPGFFETVGLLVERDLMQLDDVLPLYGGALIQLHDVVEMHVSARAEETGMPPGYFKHFRSLAEKAQERSDQRRS